MTEEFNYYRIFKGLNAAEIRYIVIGGLAVNFHGIPRMTYDIDILISLDEVNIRKTFDHLSTWGFRLKQPVQPNMISEAEHRERLINEKNLRAITFYHPTNPLAEIDLLIDAPLSFSDVRKNAVIVKIDDTEVPVISISDLILFKNHAGREQDMADIEYLRRLLEEEE